MDVGSFDHPVMPQRTKQQYISIKPLSYLAGPIILPMLIHIYRMYHWTVISYPEPLGVVETVAISDEHMIGLPVAERGQAVQRAIVHCKCPQRSVLIPDIWLIPGEIA